MDENSLMESRRGQPAPWQRMLRGLMAKSGDGFAPPRLPVEGWDVLLRALIPRLRDRDEEERRAVLGLAEMILRFSRPDGSPTFAPAGEEARGPEWRKWAKALGDPGIATVCRWWFGGRPDPATLGPPPLPAFGDERSPLAVLRADWSKEGDLLAVDARAPSRGHLFEATIGGRPVLGPSWRSSGADGDGGRASRRGWKTGPEADCVEWSFRQGPAKITRCAVLLRGRKLAILGEEWASSGDAASWSVGIHPGVVARPVAGSRMVSLGTKSGTGPIRAIPLGLPSLPYATDRGAFGADPAALRLTQKIEGGRAWLPLLISWDEGRKRRLPQWRRLTVSERSRACGPGVAVAARISWGPGESFVVYRSLARPANRAFLGHQTSARFLVGRFTEAGDVVPLLKIEG